MKIKPNKQLWEVDGSWRFSENFKYIKFLEANLSIFLSDQLRRTKKIFEKMARKITTRTPRPCRSQHQKMIQKFDNQQQILNRLRPQLQKAQKKYMEQKKVSQIKNKIKLQQIEIEQIKQTNIEIQKKIQVPELQELILISNDKIEIQKKLIIPILKMQILNEDQNNNKQKYLFEELLQNSDLDKI